jgi:hypothetical protein
VIAVDTDGDDLVVRTRVAPPAQAIGMFADYTWTALGERLRVEITPDGFEGTLPRLGLTTAPRRSTSPPAAGRRPTSKPHGTRRTCTRATWCT